MSIHWGSQKWTRLWNVNEIRHIPEISFLKAGGSDRKRMSRKICVNRWERCQQNICGSVCQGRIPLKAAEFRIPDECGPSEEEEERCGKYPCEVN
jgi:hypothetical protein